MIIFFKTLNNLCVFLSEFYEPGALMVEEEGAVMVGLLVGLNVIDANLCLKGEDLDSQVKLLPNLNWVLIESLYCRPEVYL